MSEVYIGNNELVLYLKERKNKSFWSFLLHCRKVIISSMVSSATSGPDLDSTWTRRFLTEVKNLELDFDAFKEKVMTERLRRAGELENFWRGVIRECEKRQDLSEYEAEKDRILFALSEVNNKIRMTRTELAGISDEWESLDDFDRDIGGKLNEEDENNNVSSGTSMGGDFNRDIGGDSNEIGNNSISPGTAMDDLGPNDHNHYDNDNHDHEQDYDNDHGNEQDYDNDHDNEQDYDNNNGNEQRNEELIGPAGKLNEEGENNNVSSCASIIGRNSNEVNNSISPGTAMGNLGPNDHNHDDNDHDDNILPCRPRRRGYVRDNSYHPRVTKAIKKIHNHVDDHDHEQDYNNDHDNEQGYDNDHGNEQYHNNNNGNEQRNEELIGPAEQEEMNQIITLDQSNSNTSNTQTQSRKNLSRCSSSPPSSREQSMLQGFIQELFTLSMRK
ncbi:hypothetical protein C1645_746211 [Glomus cerebriforme]|uniref:Uncharacterized protein n=1 Tax=Glomus cerebriforme TaxID=658196 RepID=A0A397RZ42_9GLOM|nr:hypothetical protein C1645_746211 [Glomus cerebriforme]